MTSNNTNFNFSQLMGAETSLEGSRENNYDVMRNDLVWILQQNTPLHWQGYEYELLDVVHTVYLHSPIYDDFGHRMGYRKLAERVLTKFGYKVPKNLSQLPSKLIYKRDYVPMEKRYRPLSPLSAGKPLSPLSPSGREPQTPLLGGMVVAAADYTCTHS